MAKVHRAYRHSWWQSRFQQNGMFGYGVTCQLRETLKDESSIASMHPESYRRFLRETLAKMDEAKGQQDWGEHFLREYGADWAELPEDERHRLIMWAETIPDGYAPTLVFK